MLPLLAFVAIAADPTFVIHCATGADLFEILPRPLAHVAPDRPVDVGLDEHREPLWAAYTTVDGELAGYGDPVGRLGAEDGVEPGATGCWMRTAGGPMFHLHDGGFDVSLPMHGGPEMGFSPEEIRAWEVVDEAPTVLGDRIEAYAVVGTLTAPTGDVGEARHLRDCPDYQPGVAHGETTLGRVLWCPTRRSGRALRELGPRESGVVDRGSGASWRYATAVPGALVFTTAIDDARAAADRQGGRWFDDPVRGVASLRDGAQGEFWGEGDVFRLKMQFHTPEALEQMFPLTRDFGSWLEPPAMEPTP